MTESSQATSAKIPEASQGVRIEYYTAKNLMEKFQVSRATVDRIPIKSVKVGGCRRWPVEFVQRYENRLKRR